MAGYWFVCRRVMELTDVGWQCVMKLTPHFGLSLQITEPSVGPTRPLATLAFTISSFVGLQSRLASVRCESHLAIMNSHAFTDSGLKTIGSNSAGLSKPNWARELNKLHKLWKVEVLKWLSNNNLSTVRRVASRTGRSLLSCQRAEFVPSRPKHIANPLGFSAACRAGPLPAVFRQCDFASLVVPRSCRRVTADTTHPTAPTVVSPKRCRPWLARSSSSLESRRDRRPGRPETPRAGRVR